MNVLANLMLVVGFGSFCLLFLSGFASKSLDEANGVSQEDVNLKVD